MRNLFRIAAVAACAAACSGGSTTHSDPLTAGPGIKIDPTTQSIAIDDSKVPMMPACSAGQLVRRGASGWECSASAPDSAQLGGKPAAAYLTSDAVAANASNLEGHPASFFLPAAAQATDSAQLGGIPASGYLGVGGVAADSAKLGGAAASAYQLAANPAANALRLNGKPDTAFLAAAAQAADSAKLGGLAPSAYQLAANPATNALELGGLSPASFARKDVSGQQLLAPMFVNSGNNALTFGSSDDFGGIIGSNSQGNFHLDAQPTKGDGHIYLAWASGKGTIFGNGNRAAPAAVASIDNLGNVHANGDVTVDGNVQAGSLNGLSIFLKNGGTTTGSCDAICALSSANCISAKKSGAIAACSSLNPFSAQPTACMCADF